MIGVGIDLVQLSRFERSLERTPELRERLFTEAERDLTLESLAGRFAAKEALAKALGAPGGPEGLAWHDVQIGREPSGAPTLTWRGTVAARARALGAVEARVSISHDGDYATAIVVLV